MRATLFLLILFVFPLTEHVIASNLYEPTTLKVWRLSFKGNINYTSLVLEEVIATEQIPNWKKWIPFLTYDEADFSELEIRRDVVRLERFYKRRGFIFCNINYTITEGDEWWKRIVVFDINAGPGVIINTVKTTISDSTKANYILNQRNFKEMLNKLPYKSGKRYESIRSSEVKGQINSELKNMGFGFAESSVDTQIDTTRLTANITIQIEPGPLTYVQTYNVIGYKTVTKELILKEANLKEGELYNQSKIGEAQQQLFNHHLYRFVTLTLPEQPKDSLITMNLRVQENELRIFSVQGGFGTEELARTEVSWSHLNPFGNTHRITARARTSVNWDLEIRQARLGFDYQIPYVFNTKSSITTSPFINYQNEYSYTLNQTGINNAYLYQWNQELSASVAYEFTANKIGDRRTTRINIDSLQLYNISSVQFAGYYREGFFGKTATWFLNPSVEFSGLLGSGTYQYQKFYLDARRYINLGKSGQVAIKINTGIIHSTSEDSLPAAVLFYAGGTSSVRGWNRYYLGPKQARTTETGKFNRFVPIGGRFMLAASLELRKDITWPFRNFSFAVFADAGQVWRGFKDINPGLGDTPIGIVSGQSYSALQTGVGGGLIYQSPIGSIRLDIGYKLNPTEADLNIFKGVNYGSSISRWGIHFSLGNPF